jgi:hypothetical protein
VAGALGSDWAIVGATKSAIPIKDARSGSVGTQQARRQAMTSPDTLWKYVLKGSMSRKDSTSKGTIR